MTATPLRPQRIRIAPGMEISRALTGLWQVADIEKDGALIDPEEGATLLQAFVRAGFDTIDMADHYGSAEIIAGRLLKRGDDHLESEDAIVANGEVHQELTKVRGAETSFAGVVCLEKASERRQSGHSPQPDPDVGLESGVGSWRKGDEEEAIQSGRDREQAP